MGRGGEKAGRDEGQRYINLFLTLTGDRRARTNCISDSPQQHCIAALKKRRRRTTKMMTITTATTTKTTTMKNT